MGMKQKREVVGPRGGLGLDHGEKRRQGLKGGKLKRKRFISMNWTELKDRNVKFCEGPFKCCYFCQICCIIASISFIVFSLSIPSGYSLLFDFLLLASKLCKNQLMSSQLFL